MSKFDVALLDTKEISRRIQKTYVADYFPDLERDSIDVVLKRLSTLKAENERLRELIKETREDHVHDNDCVGTALCNWCERSLTALEDIKNGNS